jgi:D-sedoheptulose 7-phosphate isomerase
MSGRFEPAMTPARDHIDRLAAAVAALRADAAELERWGGELADALSSGGRLLAVGNGGSAAQAQHLTSELVGRYRDDRPAFSAISLCAEPSALTAIGNDYGIEAMFARQVAAHGRAGDVLVALSTSGRSPNVLAAVAAAEERGLTTWGLTGPGDNPLALACDEAIRVESSHTATVQEIHLVCVHLLCTAFDARLEQLGGRLETAGEAS